MNLIRPSYEIIEQGPGLQGIYDIIEIAGKTSYKSKVEGGVTAEKFVKWRAEEKHGAVLEFGTVYLKLEVGSPMEDPDYLKKFEIVRFYKTNKYSVVHEDSESRKIEGMKHGTTIGVYYITTNYRVIVENNRQNDLQFLCDIPEDGHEKRYCVRFILDRFTGEEFLRHRVFSFCRESTRYCNYSKEKFNSNITFIIPPWIPKNILATGNDIAYWDGDWVDMKKLNIVKYGTGTKKFDKVDHWLNSLHTAELSYLHLTKKDEDWDEGGEKEWTAQEARTVLPCAIKSPLIMCGFEHDYYHWFHLRALGTTGAPHPQAKELAYPLMKEFIKRGYIDGPMLYKSTERYSEAYSKTKKCVVLVYSTDNKEYYDFVDDETYTADELEFEFGEDLSKM